MVALAGSSVSGHAKGLIFSLSAVSEAARSPSFSLPRWASIPAMLGGGFGTDRVPQLQIASDSLFVSP